VTGPGKGLLVSGYGFMWFPKRLRFYCGNIRSEWLGAAKDKRTTVQIKCPHIIEGLLINLTTEDEELGTDHGCGWIVTTIGPRTVDYNVGPLSRYWSAKL
jgi:hypothetical protein